MVFLCIAGLYTGLQMQMHLHIRIHLSLNLSAAGLYTRMCPDRQLFRKKTQNGMNQSLPSHVHDMEVVLQVPAEKENDLCNYEKNAWIFVA